MKKNITIWNIFLTIGLWSSLIVAFSDVPLASLGTDGRIVYGLYANHEKPEKLNRIPDYSFAGYKRGGVTIPTIKVVKTLSPQPGDNHDRIQDAITEIAEMPLDSNGFRGALLLKKGRYEVGSTIYIPSSGIVLRGEGQGEDGTVLFSTTTNKISLISINSRIKLRGGKYVYTRRSHLIKTNIKEAEFSFVPTGSKSIKLESTKGFQVGDLIGIERSPLPAWIENLQPLVDNWKPEKYKQTYYSYIVSISGNTIFFDTPLGEPFYNNLVKVYVFKVSFVNHIQNSGVEDLRIDSIYQSDTDENHCNVAVELRGVMNSWACRISAIHLRYGCIHLTRDAINNTIEDCAFLDPKSKIIGGRRYAFCEEWHFVDYNLFQRCYAQSSRHDYNTWGAGSVFLDCYSEQTYADVGPHQRFAASYLYDNVYAGQMTTHNHMEIHDPFLGTGHGKGSGHGWTGVQGMFWNCVSDALVQKNRELESLWAYGAKKIEIKNPKAYRNYCVGCKGLNGVIKIGDGENLYGYNGTDAHWESWGTHVPIRSLYLQQLKDRLGEQAVKNITTPAQRKRPIWEDLKLWKGRESPWNTICLEAETATLTYPMQVFSDPKATGEKYVQTALNTSSSYKKVPKKGHIQHAFNVKLSGEYKILARVIAPNGRSDSFWIKMDDGDWFRWMHMSPLGNEWSWKEVRSRREVKKYHLTAGKHTITFAYREVGAMLDRILITKDLSFFPHNIHYKPAEHGIVSGVNNQVLNHGSKTFSVKARPLFGYQFDRWSDGVTNAIRTDLASLNSSTFTAFFKPLPGGFRVQEYVINGNNFSGKTYTLNLNHDLVRNYFVLIRGSREGNGSSSPENNYIRVVADPFGNGGISRIRGKNYIELERRANDFPWNGVITVVECLNPKSFDGFTLLDIVTSDLRGQCGENTLGKKRKIYKITKTWKDIDQITLFGGCRGGGGSFNASTTSKNQGTSIFTRLYPSGSNTISWVRNAGGEDLVDAQITTYIVKWNKNWTIQRVRVKGSKGGSKQNVHTYTTASISPVTRSNTWVWATGVRQDAGIGDNAESCMVTLGDGVHQNETENKVAVKSYYKDQYDFDVYVLSHPKIHVQHFFKQHGNRNALRYAMNINPVHEQTSFSWGYNSCSGTGNYHPRELFWTHYSDDKSELIMNRGFSGQPFSAWLQAVDFYKANQ